MYNDFPDEQPDFQSTKMGLFRDDNYCTIHDLISINQPKFLQELIFMSDYHQLSFIRFFILSKMGRDAMPRFGKDMPKINQMQPHLAIDPRINLFHFKKQNFHYFQQIGKNFLCYGQSYNHIPGHGVLTRKDLLAQ